MPERNLKGKVAIIIGATSAIGRAVALTLSRSGAAVVLHDPTDSPEGLVAEVEHAGGQALAVQADLSKAEEVQRLFQETIAHFGKVDILVNDSRAILETTLADTKEGEFERVKAIKECSNATVYVCEQAARHLADGGRIINFCSSLGSVFDATFHAEMEYDRAIRQIHHILSKELGPRRITLNTVSPGSTDDEVFEKASEKMLGRFRRSGTEEEKQKEKTAEMERLAQPQAFANVVAHLVADEAYWLTGQTIRANWAMS